MINIDEISDQIRNKKTCTENLSGILPGGGGSRIVGLIYAYN